LNAACKIVLYFIAVLLIGALLAPPLYWAGTALIPMLREEQFQKFFNRAALIAAAAFLWPLAKSFRVKSVRELGIEPNSGWLRDLVTGLIAAIGLMIVLCVALDFFDGFKWHAPKDRKLGDIPKVLLSSATVSLLEEALFRGAFLGVFLRTMGKWNALFASSFLYSIVHFIKPRDVEIAAADVHWYTGFELLPAVFSQFGEPMLVLAGFTTLFAVGWVLGYVTMVTRSLWMAIGLHAGWVICVQGFGKIAKLAKNKLPWIGSELVVGIAPLITVIFTGLLCWLLVRRRAAKS
jgi:membrane protease YdiL (CAAX protease family)